MLIPGRAGLRILKVHVVVIATALHVAPTALASREDPAPEPVYLAGENTVRSAGSGVLEVVVPDGASFAARLDPPRSHGFASLTTTGTFAALVLVHETEAIGTSTKVNALQVHVPKPYGCNSTATSCLSPYDHALFQSATPPVVENGYALYRYPPGDYKLYLLTNPGASATATFGLRGVDGAATLEADGPATARFDYRRDAAAPLASLHGSYVHTMRSPGFVTMGLYQVGGTAGVEPGPFQYQECLTKGRPGPLSPDECLAAALLTPTTGDIVVGDYPILVRPAYFAGSIGGFSLTDRGLGTWQSSMLESGMWTNTFRVFRGGATPAVAAWALWLELPWAEP